jgi:uncharacterized protein
MTFRMAVVALALIANCRAVHAQKAPPVDPARIEAAQKLMSAMGVDAQMDVAINTMINGMGDIIKQKNPGRKAEVDEVFDKLRAKFTSRKAEMRELSAVLWAEKLTVAEIGDIVTFFKSPAGQKMLAVQPEIMQRSMKIGMEWGRRIGAEIDAEARSEFMKRKLEL